jgi:ApaG protein
MYLERTGDIEVMVNPYFLEDQSDPDDNRYVWGYTVTINNLSNDSIRLINRYWNITDENGVVDEVFGPGVVGEQPRLEPGGHFEYSSGCPLDTPSGIMFGHYEMENSSGVQFRVAIPAFSLDLPNFPRVLN